MMLGLGILVGGYVVIAGVCLANMWKALEVKKGSKVLLGVGMVLMLIGAILAFVS